MYFIVLLFFIVIIIFYIIHIMLDDVQLCQEKPMSVHLNYHYM